MELSSITVDALWWFKTEFHNPTVYNSKCTYLAYVLQKRYHLDTALMIAILEKLFGTWESHVKKRNILRKCIRNGMLDLFQYMIGIMKFTTKTQWGMFKHAIQEHAWDIAKFIHDEYPAYVKKYLIESFTKKDYFNMNALVQFCLQNNIVVTETDTATIFAGTRGYSEMYGALTKTFQISNHMPYLLAFMFPRCPVNLTEVYPKASVELIAEMYIVGNSNFSQYEAFVSQNPQARVPANRLAWIIVTMLSLEINGYSTFASKLTTFLRTVKLPAIHLAQIFRKVIEKHTTRNGFADSIARAMPWMLEELNNHHDILESLYDLAIDKAEYVFAWFFAMELFIHHDEAEPYTMLTHFFGENSNLPIFRQTRNRIDSALAEIQYHVSVNNNHARTYAPWCRLHRHYHESMYLIHKVRTDRKETR